MRIPMFVAVFESHAFGPNYNGCSKGIRCVTDRLFALVVFDSAVTDLD